MKVIEQSYKIRTPVEVMRYFYTDIEDAGRTAYQSNDKITSDSAPKFVNKIMLLGHESVIEHAVLSVKFITDRFVTHELVRHRICSFTEQSTRYCKYRGKDLIFIRPVFWTKDDPAYAVWCDAMEKSEFYYHCMLNDSWNRSQEEARVFVSDSLKAEIIVTANLREWRHILKLRTSKKASAQMRALMLPLLYELQSKFPEVFSDIKVSL